MQATNLLLTGLCVLALAACASPKVHDEVHHMDHRLSCAQMEHEIREMEKHHMSVEESKGVTFRNTLTTLLFFPVTMATYDNVEDAQESSRKRQKHLIDIYMAKGCANDGGYGGGFAMGGGRTMIAPVSYQYAQTQPVAHRYARTAPAQNPMAAFNAPPVAQPVQAQPQHQRYRPRYQY